MNNQDDWEEIEVTRLGTQIGIGNLMTLASKMWGVFLSEQRISGGEFCVGPCTAMVVKCPDCTRHECDWCCGCGWLTEHVAKLKSANG